MLSLSASVLKSKLGDALSRVQYTRERVKITRRGKTIAVLVSAEDYEYWAGIEAEEDAEDIRLADEALKEYERTGESVSLEDMKKELGL